MTIFTLFLAIGALLVVLGLGVDRILRARDSFEIEDVEARLTTLDELTRERAMYARELKDIELEHDTGKISQEDHDRQASRFRRKWLALDAEIERRFGLDEGYRARIQHDLDARLAAARAQASGRVPRHDRQICASCGAAAPLRAARCAECDAALPARLPLTPASAAGQS